MRKNGTYKTVLGYALFGLLAAWTMLVLFRFFQEHPLNLRYASRLVRDYQLPPLPTNTTKIILAGKHILLAGLLAITGMMAGRRLLTMAGAERSEDRAYNRWRILQELVLALGLGWGLLMYLTFLLGTVGGLYTWAAWILIALVLLLCIREFPSLFGDLRAAFVPDTTEGSTPVTRIGLAVVLVMLVMLAIIALAPSITHDAMVYHLGVPRIYVDAHRIVAVPYNLFSNNVLNMEMLYALVLLVDGFIVANLIHFIMGVGVLVLLYSFTREHFGGVMAVLATLIFFFNPLMLNQMPIAYTDIGMTLYFMLAMICLWRWKTEGGERWFVLSCVFAGIFAGMKYTSIYGLLSVAIMIAAAQLTSGEGRFARTVTRLAVFGGIVALLVSPYLIKNYLIAGNPVYPVMYDIFGGRWLMPRQVERMLAYVDSHGMGHDWRRMLALPWNITIFGKSGFANFDTAITPLWLIFLPALLVIRPKPAVVKWSAVVCVVYVLGWAAYTHITRYMMPMFPLLSLLCAYTIISLTEKAGLLSMSFSTIFRTGAMAVCGLVWFSFSYFYPLRVPSEFGAVVWGQQTRDEFLTMKVPNYAVFKYINENLPEEAHIAFFWDNRGFFCERSKIGDSVIEAPIMIELVHDAGSAAAFHMVLRERGITHVFFNQLFFLKFPTYRVSEEDSVRFEDDLRVFRSFLSEYCEPLFSATGATLYEIRA